MSHRHGASVLSARSPCFGTPHVLDQVLWTCVCVWPWTLVMTICDSYIAFLSVLRGYNLQRDTKIIQFMPLLQFEKCVDTHSLSGCPLWQAVSWRPCV